MNAPHQPGEIVADRYRIVETLGEGGNGITYKAELLQESQLDEAQLDNNRYVALKALSLRHMEDWKPLELFEREARILQHLNHPRIPRYLDYFHVDTPENRAFYIVQELVEGQSLAAMVEKGWRTNEAGVRRILIQVLEILVYLQDLKPPVIHRDIKPQNLIWGKDSQIFLVDFGAVRDTYKSTLARGSTVVGTFGYMAPEQFQGQAVPATDLYGLGATALFLLTHRSPAELPEERLKISFRSRVQISESFADWLEKAIEPDAVDRFVSAREALGLLRGNVVIGKRRSSFPWHTVVGMGVVGFTAAIGLNLFQYRMLNFLGLKPDRICDAASAGNRKTLEDYFDKGGDPKITFSGDRSLLSCAIESDRIEMVELLIDRGADLKIRNAQLETPLHLALRNSQKEITTLLIKSGANVNAKNREGHLPIQLVFHREWKDVAELLLTKGANLNPEVINDSYYHGYTLLHIAVENGWIDWTERLLSKGANANAKMVLDTTPLHIAVRKGRYDLVKLLLDRGADVNAKALYAMDTEASVTPLRILLEGVGSGFLVVERESPINKSAQFHKISKETKIAIAKLLIDRGADVNIKFSNNVGVAIGTSLSLLHTTAFTGEREIAEMLIEKGVDINARDGKGETPLHWAVRNGQNGVVELLISHGANINIKNHQDRTPLQIFTAPERSYSVSPSARKIARLLVSKGADSQLNSKQLLKLGLQYDVREIVARFLPEDADMSQAGSFLHSAANYGSLDIVKLLINRGINVNVRDENSNTALHFAVKERHARVISFLVRQGADVNARNKSGYAPLHSFCYYYGNNEANIASILLENGANVNIKDNHGRTPIYYWKPNSLSKHKKLDELDFLIREGADVNAIDFYGFTPLHWLAQSKNPDITHATLLISHGAQVNAKDFYGQTPLYWAMRRRNADLVSLLELHGGITSCEALQCPEIWETPLLPRSK